MNYPMSKYVGRTPTDQVKLWAYKNVPYANRFFRIKKVGRTPYQRQNYRISRLEMGYGKELKTHDKEFASGAVGTAGTLTHMTGISQGTTSITRIGLSIRPKNLFWKTEMNAHASTTTSTRVRIIIIIDRQFTGTAPTAIQVLEADGTKAYKEHDTRPRFRFMMDRVFLLSPDGHPGDRISAKGFLRFPKWFKIWYSGVANTEADAKKNQIYLYCVSDQGTNSPTVNFQTRIRFTDA